MTVLMRAREITGRPVVAISSADAVAEVKDVVISHPSASVVGFTLNKRGFLGSPLKEVLRSPAETMSEPPVEAPVFATTPSAKCTNEP